MKNDLSKTVVTENGIITDISEGVELPCPTCKRKGRVVDPKCFGKAICYYDPITSDTLPHVTCRTCNGTGWIFTNNVDIEKEKQ